LGKSSEVLWQNPDFQLQSEFSFSFEHMRKPPGKHRGVQDNPEIINTSK
jgi:hypothetical protein